MKKQFENYGQLLANTSNEILGGRKGWTKGKCLDEKGCNTITIWNSQKNGLKCNDGICANCGGKVKRTVWSTTSKYVVVE